MPHAPPQLDSRIEIVTPENIAFHYLVAGPFRRLPAYLIDCTICVSVVVVGFIVLGLFTSAIGIEGLGIGLWLLLIFALNWFYFGLFETIWNGQTPGKRLMGLRVLSIDGQPINAMQAILRNVLRAVDAMPASPVPTYMVALLAMSCNRRYQRLGDLTCGTMVVIERRSKLHGVAPIAHEEVIRFAQSLPVSFVASRSLAHALGIYVARRHLFSPARRFEMARVLAEPLAAQLGLPAETNPDLLLCALYYRAFIGDRPSERPVAAEVEAAEMADSEVAVR